MDYILIISASTHLRIIIRIIFLNFLYTPGPFEEDKLGKSWWLAQIQSLLAVHSRSGCVQELNNQTEIELCIYNARTVLLFSLEKIPISTCIQQYISPTCRKWLLCPVSPAGISLGRSIQQHLCGSKQFIRLRT